MIEKFTTLDLTRAADPRHRPERKSRASRPRWRRRSSGPASRARMAEFFTFLRTDPQFYAKTPRELLSYSAYVSKKADWKLGRDDRLPAALPSRHPCRCPTRSRRSTPAAAAGSRACLMNTYNLPARPLYTLAALTLHECTPGHSFQAALALEGPERPPFRRGTSFSGYGEGWGLYTEWLGTVMGIYETPYEDFGRLTYEMWRACRLVIDTGIHQFGWSREQAMDYLRDERGAVRARDHDRGRALHRVAGPGARVQARRDPDPPASPRGRADSSARSSTSGNSTTPSSRSARCRCRCSSSAWRKFIADGGVNPPQTAR